jgi:hypothetical protein
MMPARLARGLKARRQSRRKSGPRFVEQLKAIDIADLCRWRVFPAQHDWHKAHLLELPFRYPFLESLVIFLENIEANHRSGYIEIIRLRWIRTGFVTCPSNFGPLIT